MKNTDNLVERLQNMERHTTRQIVMLLIVVLVTPLFYAGIEYLKDSEVIHVIDRDRYNRLQQMYTLNARLSGDDNALAAATFSKKAAFLLDDMSHGSPVFFTDALITGNSLRVDLTARLESMFHLPVKRRQQAKPLQPDLQPLYPREKEPYSPVP